MAADLIVVSTEFWNAKRQARKELLYRALLTQGMVQSLVYVEPPAAWWREGFSAAGSRRGGQGVVLSRWNCPLPGDRIPLLTIINRRIIAARIARRFRREGAPPVGVFYHPVNWLIVRHLRGPTRWFYDWTEDWAVYHRSAFLARVQREAVRGSDGVIAVCRGLYDEAREIRGGDDTVLLLPNATALCGGEAGAKESPDLAPIPRPRIGVMGHVGPWMDAELIESLAEREPSWEWVILGDTRPPWAERLGRRPNIHLLGVRPYEELPRYMAGMDALVAPYRGVVHAGSSRGDASKIYDYLSSGKPVLSSILDTALAFPDAVRTVSRDIEQWRRALAEALGERDPAAARRRRALARRNTWSMRARTFRDWVEPRKEPEAQG